MRDTARSWRSKSERPIHPSLRDAYLRQASWTDSVLYGRRLPAVRLQDAERLLWRHGVWKPAQETP